MELDRSILFGIDYVTLCLFPSRMTFPGKKERLLKIFDGWCDNVIDLILATDEDEILRRDIYDLTPVFTWGRGHVTLLGDFVHAVQPNLGQGGCLAIEDSYLLAMELAQAWKDSVESGKPLDVVSSLRRARRFRVAIIHGIARMSSTMLSSYSAYLGEGLGPLSFLTKFRIRHPVMVGGRFLADIAMPLIVSWVLGGYSSKLEGRPLCCRLSDKHPVADKMISGMKANDQLRRWFEDDGALKRAINGESVVNNDLGVVPVMISLPQSSRSLIRGFTNDSPSQVSNLHARISYKDGAYFLTDLGSKHGTWITDNEGRRYRISPNAPTRFRPSYVIEFGSDKRAWFGKAEKDLTWPGLAWPIVPYPSTREGMHLHT
ncbi:hypothetical protein CRG98_040191 [Punica granatum]|uniref:Zeaxanthin epoxidase, chloroplastic n=1 Tax=Punica granatum TaxID=22663 RepID=A0A2I0I6J7_PUNGR|nr:hypothetical protein CRG98_040191 [Punica granatum]